MAHFLMHHPTMLHAPIKNNFHELIRLIDPSFRFARHIKNDLELERALFSAMEMGNWHPTKEHPIIRSPLSQAFELALRYYAYKTRIKLEESGSQPASPATLAEQALKQLPLSYRLAPSEWLGFVPVYSRRRVGPFSLIEMGVRTHVNTEPSELFARVLVLRPKGFFLFHNHPSGDLTPSIEDRELTLQVHFLAQKLGLELLGHSIISEELNQWISIGSQPNLC